MFSQCTNPGKNEPLAVLLRSGQATANRTDWQAFHECHSALCSGKHAKVDDTFFPALQGSASIGRLRFTPQPASHPG